MRQLLVLILLLLSACDAGFEQLPPPDWKTAPREYTCSIEQLDLVRTQYNICIKTDYLSAYCYGTAIMSQCTKRKV